MHRLNLKAGLLLLIVFAAANAATSRNWQDATLTAVKVERGESGAAAMPIGTMIVAMPIASWRTLYRIETSSTVFILDAQHKKPLNLTVNGKTKIAVEDQKAFLLDDSGKEIKLPIIQKVAKVEPTKAPY